MDTCHSEEELRGSLVTHFLISQDAPRLLFGLSTLSPSFLTVCTFHLLSDSVKAHLTHFLPLLFSTSDSSLSHRNRGWFVVHLVR